MLLLALACVGPLDDSASVDASGLTSPDAWQVVHFDDDPFDDRQDVHCEGFGIEGDVFEVLTVSCPYATFEQPAGYALPDGTTLRFDAWHLPLTALEAAEGHLAVRVGDEVAEVFVPIPSPAAAYTLTLTLAAPLDEGDPIYFHVHNHGNNSWYLGPETIL
ncbi:MAG: hypothetical protein AAF602_17730 [Myxococcota bacterium]